MLKKILAVLVILLAVFAIIVTRQSNEFHVSRSIEIKATPAVVFEYVNDLHKSALWSPWTTLDPNMQTTYEGANAGIGAIYKWSGNKEVGEGMMTITKSRLNESVELHLEFFKPFKAENTALFALAPKGDSTLMTWMMTGKKNFVAKAMGLFMNCDKMVGDQFEKGLSNLKTMIETQKA
jgi:hypothetical protein